MEDERDRQELHFQPERHAVVIAQGGARPHRRAGDERQGHADEGPRSEVAGDLGDRAADHRHAEQPEAHEEDASEQERQAEQQKDRGDREAHRGLADEGPPPAHLRPFEQGIGHG